MENLSAASRELFRRTPDEIFSSFDALYAHCCDLKDRSAECWRSPVEIEPRANGGRLELMLGVDGAHRLNDWSFGQICKLSSVSKDTLNKLSPETAALALRETMPDGGKPLQALTVDS